MICDYKDRAHFLLTTTNPSAVPNTIKSICIVSRVPGFPESVHNSWDDIIASNSAVRARELAYSLVTANTPFAEFASGLIRSYGQQVVQVLAENEARILSMKKDIFAWELAILEIQALLMPRPGCAK
jgi:DNA polymerase III gamma/tau subunit